MHSGRSGNTFGILLGILLVYSWVYFLETCIHSNKQSADPLRAVERVGVFRYLLPEASACTHLAVGVVSHHCNQEPRVCDWEPWDCDQEPQGCDQEPGGCDRSPQDNKYTQTININTHTKKT